MPDRRRAFDPRLGALVLALGLAFAACTKQGEPFMPARPGQVDSTKVEGSEWGHWTADNDPYYAIKSIVVPANRTLTIDPGVLVIFTRAGLTFTVKGTLIAPGKPDSLINFRPNANRGVPPVAGDFGGVVFEGGSIGRLTGFRVQYGTTGIKATGSDLEMDNCFISNHLQYGITAARTRLVLRNSTLSNCGLNGLDLNECDSPTYPVEIEHCNIGNNRYAGIWAVNSSLVARRTDIRNNGDEGDPDFSAGIHFEGLPGIDPPIFRQCNINQNLPCDLRNEMPTGIVVSADSNWWGPPTTDEMEFLSNPVVPPDPNKNNCSFNVRQICDGLDDPLGGASGVRFCLWLDAPAPNFASSSMAPGAGSGR
ncbi:MAG TPA: right-handed parallel beta-helix repeat-containing protein [Candidatus Eisenbacteria bacterium]